MYTYQFDLNIALSAVAVRLAAVVDAAVEAQVYLCVYPVHKSIVKQFRSDFIYIDIRCTHAFDIQSG